jgi:hypothetical protein
MQDTLSRIATSVELSIEKLNPQSRPRSIFLLRGFLVCWLGLYVLTATRVGLLVGARVDVLVDVGFVRHRGYTAGAMVQQGCCGGTTMEGESSLAATQHDEDVVEV